MEALINAMMDGLNALRDGDPAAAAVHLAPVAHNDDLAAAHDLQDIRLKVVLLYSQALLESGQASEARKPLVIARDINDQLGQPAADEAIATLTSRIGEAVAEQFAAAARKRTLKRSLSHSPADLANSPDAPARLVERASAALTFEDPKTAAQIAESALKVAIEKRDTRHQVMALLVLAKAEPDAAVHHLERARLIADDADAFNLLSFIVSAAKDLGVDWADRTVHGMD